MIDMESEYRKLCLIEIGIDKEYEEVEDGLEEYYKLLDKKEEIKKRLKLSEKIRDRIIDAMEITMPNFIDVINNVHVEMEEKRKEMGVRCGWGKIKYGNNILGRV